MQSTVKLGAASIQTPRIATVMWVWIAALCLSGCQRTVGQEELVGRWVLNETSRGPVTGKPPVIPSINLKPDSSFSMNNLAGSALFIRGPEQFVDIEGMGRWSLSVQDGDQVVLFHFDLLKEARTGRELTQHKGFEIAFRISSTDKALFLYYTEGDPDAVQHVRFARP